LKFLEERKLLQSVSTYFCKIIYINIFCLMIIISYFTHKSGNNLYHSLTASKIL